MLKPEDNFDPTKTPPDPKSNALEGFDSLRSDADNHEIVGPSTSPDTLRMLFPPRPWGLGAVLAAIVTALAFLGLGLIILVLATGEDAAGTALVFNASLVAVTVVIISVSLVFGPLTHGGGLPSLGLSGSRVSTNQIWLLSLGVLFAILLINGAYTTIVDLLGIDILQPPDLPFDNFSPLSLVIAGIMVSLVGPFAEEVFFRGFVLRGLNHQWGRVAALLVGSAIFSLAHANVAIIIPIFVAGVLLGWLYLRTGSLWGCIAVHGVQNAAAFSVAILL